MSLVFLNVMSQHLGCLRIAMKFGSDIVDFRMNCNNFGDPFIFNLAPSSDQNNK